MRQSVLRVFAMGAIASWLALGAGCGGTTTPPAADGGNAIDGGNPTDGGNTTDGGRTDGGNPTDGGRADGGGRDGGSGTDEQEGVSERTNDDLASAQTITLGTVVNGTIGTADGDDTDNDFYKFTATAGQVLRVTLTATGDFAPLAGIRNAGGSLIRLAGSAEGDTVATRQFYISAAGDYYVQVLDARNASDSPEGVGGAGVTYSLQVAAETVTPTPLTLPASQLDVALGTTNDVKVYSFNATAGGGYVLETTAARLTPPSSVDTILVLMNAAGATPVEVAVNDDLSNQVVDSQIRRTFPTAGAFHVVVDHYGIDFTASPVNRTVKLDARAFDTSAEFEPNDSRTTANDIAAPVSGTPTTVSGVINKSNPPTDGGAATPAVDVDFFKFDLPANTYVEILVTKPSGSNSAFAPYIAFLNPSGNVTFVNPNVPGNAPTRLEAYAFTAGSYSIAITDARNVSGTTPVGGADYTYQMRISVITRNVTALGDGPVAANMSGAVDQGGKTAWFSFNVPAGAPRLWWIDLDLSGTPNNGLSLKPFTALYNAAGSAVAGGSTPMIRDIQLEPGLYTLAVSDTDGAFSATNHTFKPRVVVAATYSIVTDNGSNTTRANALALTGDFSIVDSVLPMTANAEVWYSLGTLQAGSFISLETARSPALPPGVDGGAPRDTDTILTLTDSTGTAVMGGTNDDAAGVYSALTNFRINTTGAYFAKVTGYMSTMSTASGPFRFLVRKNVCGAASPRVFINEVFANPGTTGDANGDGTTSAVTDEFVELVNLSRISTDVSGLLLRDASGVRWRAACGTSVAAGTPHVVLGGCQAGTCTAGRSQANATPASPTGAGSAPEGLNLDDSGDVLMLIDSEGQVIDQVRTTAATASVSFARGAAGTCDVKPATTSVGVQLHNACTGASGRGFSPGKKATNTDFAPPPALTNDVCGSATPLVNGVTLVGQDTSTFANDYDAGEDSETCGGFFGGPLFVGKDAAFSISVPAGKLLRVTGTPRDSWDMGITIVTDCANAPTTCVGVGDSEGDAAAEIAEYRNEGGSARTVFVIVDSAIETSFGEFDIRADIVD